MVGSQRSTDEIVDKVRQIMVDEFEVDPAVLTREALVREDLGLDSLDGVDLVVAIEKTFRCRIAEDQARAMRTLGDIYDAIASHLAAPSEG